jgi:glycosyltransferase involved in cell wall biosynthesis
MLVDIIIPAYNPGPDLRDALKSCFKQKYKNYRVTVIDDNSAEDVKGLVSEFKNVNYIRNNKNLGPSGARNVGIKNTHGELISLLDADDVMDPNKLHLSVKEFSNPDVGLVCGNYQILVNRTRLLPPFYKRTIKVDHAALMRQNFVASGSTTFRRSLIERIGGFDERFWISEDYACWVRLSEICNIKYIHKVLYYYSVSPGNSSLTQRSDIQKDHDKNIKIIRRESRERIKCLSEKRELEKNMAD